MNIALLLNNNTNSKSLLQGSLFCVYRGTHCFVSGMMIVEFVQFVYHTEVLIPAFWLGFTTILVGNCTRQQVCKKLYAPNIWKVIVYANVFVRDCMHPLFVGYCIRQRVCKKL